MALVIGVHVFAGLKPGVTIFVEPMALPRRGPSDEGVLRT